MTITLQDHLALANVRANIAERDAIEGVIHLVTRFADPAVSRAAVLNFSMQEAVDALKEVMPKIAEAAKNGGTAIGDISKLH